MSGETVIAQYREIERRAEAVGGRQGRTPLGRDLLEVGQIELVSIQHEGVAAGPTLDRARLELVTQPRDVDLDGLRRLLGRLLPELADQALQGNGPAGAKQERGKDGLLPRAAERKPVPAAVEHLERPQHSVFHLDSPPLPEPTVPP